MDYLRKLFGMGGKQPKESYDEAQTQPLDAMALARALKAEGRRHLANGTLNYVQGEDDSSADAHYVLIGNSDGLNAIPDFSVFGVAETSRGEKDAARVALHAFAHSVLSNTVLNLLAVEGAAEERSFEQAVESGFVSAQGLMDLRYPGDEWSMCAGIMFADVMVIGRIGELHPIFLDRTRIGALKDEGHNGSMIGDEVSFISHPVPRDAYLLLGTQGLFKALSNEQIQSKVLNAEGPQAACDALKQGLEKEDEVQRGAAVLFYFPLDFDAWR